MRSIVLALAGVLSLSVSASAWAENSHPHIRESACWSNPALSVALDLI